MQYPLISEYVRAIQDASDNLDELAYLKPVLDDHGEPFRSSGAFAVVFKMKDEQTGKYYALKCFTEEQVGRAEAYQMIADELDCIDFSYVTSVKYLEKEIFVDSSCEEDEFPVLLMDWVEGETMETYIANNYQDEYAMGMLCYRFCKMAAWIRSQPFAHGDIKPDNIMVRPDGTLTLVDYDGMFVPAMKGQKSPTIGTKDFSHPLRTVDDFDETIDDFALASIALSLKAISLKQSLHDEFGASDRLLLSAADYHDLSKSKVITTLQELLNDEELATLLSMFLLVNTKKNLAMCSFRLLVVKKPENKIEVLSTEVTDEDLKNAITDEFGVKYSRDGKRLLQSPVISLLDWEIGIPQNEIRGKYPIRRGTQVICNRAFEDQTMNDLELPNSLTTIGDNVFYNCCCLSNIIIPKNVKNLIGNPFAGWDGKLECLSPYFIYEDYVLFNKEKNKIIAFRKNEELSYVIPYCVTSIGMSAFCDCATLTSIVIPKGVTNIGENAFCYCTSLTNIEIPNSVTNIGEDAFMGCHSLTNIVIPNGVTNIEEGTFSDCYSLVNIVIPNSVTSIGENAFCYCHSFTNIEIPNSVTNIGNGAFRQCKSLINIVIPKGVTNIGENAFCYCTSLTNIVIPKGVTNIGEDAFMGCHSLTNIEIPNSVTNIGNGAFRLCESLTNIVIPKGVTNIGEYAFGNCESLTNIEIPNSVTNIGNGAFRQCESLTSITIPNSVTYIGKGAFYGCNFSSELKKELTSRFGDKIFEYTW